MLIESTYLEKKEVEADKWYEYSPDTVTENENETCTIPWDMPVHTDKEIKPNRSDFIIKDQELKKCVLIDMAIPAERNTSVKMFEKVSKYERKYQRCGTFLPVAIWALGLVNKGLGK